MRSTSILWSLPSGRKNENSGEILVSHCLFWFFSNMLALYWTKGFEFFCCGSGSKFMFKINAGPDPKHGVFDIHAFRLRFQMQCYFANANLYQGFCHWVKYISKQCDSMQVFILDFHTTVRESLSFLGVSNIFCRPFLGELLAPVTYGPAFQHRYVHLGAKCLLRGFFFLPKLLRFCFLVCFKGHFDFLIRTGAQDNKISFFNARLLFWSIIPINCREL